MEQACVARYFSSSGTTVDSCYQSPCTAALRCDADVLHVQLCIPSQPTLDFTLSQGPVDCMHVVCHLLQIYLTQAQAVNAA